MDKLPLRSEIDAADKWRLEDMYESDALWEKDFEKITKLLKKPAAYKGRLGESGELLLECYRLQEKISMTMEKLYVYARMRKDEDNGIAKYQEMASRIEVLAMQFQAETAFFEPELLSLGEKKIMGFLRETPGLADYDFTFREMFRLQEHVLSEPEERILAMARECAGTGDDAFSMFNNADIKFPSIKDENGKRTELTKGRYTVFLESKNRNVRKAAFKALYATYGSYKNTLAACYAGSVRSDRFYSAARKFESCIAASLSSDNVPVEVYDNLIDTVHANLNKLGDYLKIRKKALGLSRLHMYDLYTPIVNMPAKKYTYEEGKEIVLAALAPMGKEYTDKIKKAYTDGWIDVRENQGKTSGAYSWGCYLSHPYVLLNWQGSVNDVFTLAHELGHAMHSYYSNKTQSYVKSGYKIFVAEVASTVNENLLFHYLLENSQGDVERAYLLNHYLEEFRGTVYRQVMFAEFEKMSHAALEESGALSCDQLCEMYYNLNLQYFGKHVTVDPEIALEWSRIPHFYTSFYVYKYATGFSAAVALANGILSGDKGKLKAYKDFLKSGGSDYPLELLKHAGVDLTTPKPIEEALSVFSDNLKKLEALLC